MALENFPRLTQFRQRMVQSISSRQRRARDYRRELLRVFCLGCDKSKREDAAAGHDTTGSAEQQATQFYGEEFLLELESIEGRAVVDGHHVHL